MPFLLVVFLWLRLIFNIEDSILSGTSLPLYCDVKIWFLLFLFFHKKWSLRFNIRLDGSWDRWLCILLVRAHLVWFGNLVNICQGLIWTCLSLCILLCLGAFWIILIFVHFFFDLEFALSFDMRSEILPTIIWLTSLHIFVSFWLRSFNGGDLLLNVASITIRLSSFMSHVLVYANRLSPEASSALIAPNRWSYCHWPSGSIWMNGQCTIATNTKCS